MKPSDPEKSKRGPAGGKDPQGRAARLKAALQSNIARRKAQARARAQAGEAVRQDQENERDE